ncbi:DUF350 domain-containing protein [Roseibacillus ishigakijimensis]|uniref:DUF350 domain-containing protein n=1 Tax=Roseibacillus ishigakijimensis TaxID=454146 RepID=A0A934RTX8_9BACT|nr:DUF350 domain-containing protein [Roseibacillus ishigakijimensis]MBK1835601.1 DUF350 domain-containing protein [Roseibacillus ishigakijimensis]
MSELFQFQIPEETSNWMAWLYLLQSLVLLAIGSIAFALLRKVKLAHQLAEKDNPAFAISYGGFLGALSLVIAAVLTSPSQAESWQGEFLSSLYWNGGSLLLLLAALLVNDFVIFSKFSNRKEILTDRNCGLAAVEAGTFLGTALLISASLSEQHGPAPLGEPWLTLLYFVLGQALFLLYARLYPFVTSLDLHGELEKDNPAIGLAYGGSLLAFAWLVGEAMRNYDSLTTIFLVAILYIIVLGVLRQLAHLLIVRKVSLQHELSQDRNWGIGLLEAVLTLVVAVFLTSSW